MKKSMRNRMIVAVALLALCVSAPAAEKQAATWTGSWAASPMLYAPRRGQPFIPLTADSTYRSVVRLSIGGAEFRVQLTNEYGSTPLKIGAAHVALSAGSAANDGTIKQSTDHALTFGGRPTVTIPPGAMVLSDVVPMGLAALSNLDVSIYLAPQELPDGTCHRQAWSTNFVSKGDTTGASEQKDARQIDSWCFVKGVDVRTSRQAAAIVAFGDSITDGGHSTLNANHRWPNFLAERLLANKRTAEVGVLNEGIGGNRILDGGGANPNAIARFDRDVLAQSGVKYLVILESINDIGALARVKDPSPSPLAENLIFGLAQMVERAHQHGIKVFGTTVTPYKGSVGFRSAGEQVRQTINHWIRTSGTFDGVIDFDQAVRDPADPLRILPAYDFDHVHPNDAGYKVMANAIDLASFR